MSNDPASPPPHDGPPVPAAPESATDVDTHVTPTAATPVPSDAEGGDTPWSWWALHHTTSYIDPATGQARSARAALWLDAAVHRLAHHWSKQNSRPLKLYRDEIAAAQAFDNHLDSFAVRLRLGEDKPHVVIALDVAAAQGLVAPLIAENTGLQPPASPGPTDALDATTRGLLEFLSLAGVDALLLDFALNLPIHLETFGGAELLKPQPRETRRAEVSYRLHAGPARGEMRIAVIDADAQDTQALAHLTAAPVDDSFDLTLALPPVSLSAVEQQAMAAGDVLLLGGADLASLINQATVVTRTGWSLGAANFQDLQATDVSVDVTPHAPRILEPEDAVTPHLGNLKTNAQAWRDRDVEAPLRLILDSQAPITLVMQGQAVAQGEPVILDGQLGVRLLSVSPLPASEPNA